MYAFSPKMAFHDENVLDLTVSEVLKDCHVESTEPCDDLCKYYMKLLSLNPRYSQNFVKTTTKESLKAFIKTCIDKILDDKNPSMLALKMMKHFENIYDTSENLIEKNENNIEKRTEPLMKEILQAKPNAKEEFEKLLRRISIYLVLKSGLGNPGNIQVLREGTAALHSVFTMTDLKLFVGHQNKDKIRQLEELLTIVSGIRIFNKDCGKGGENIPELAPNLSEAVEATSLALSHCLIRIMERVNLLTTAIDSYIVVCAETGTVTIDISDAGRLTPEDYDHVCKILTVYRQYEVFVRKLIGDMDRIHVDSKELVLNFSGQLYDLHSLVRYRTAVPADQVFPHFKHLWSHWRAMQCDMFLVSTVNDVMWGLDSAHERLEAPHGVIDALLAGRRVISDAQRILLTEEDKIDIPINRCQVVYPGDKNYADVALQYLGFCGLCICKGALIPANPTMGLCRWAGKYYVFCSAEHGKYFGLNPDRYRKETLEYIRNNPELINFLQIYDEIHAVRQVKTLTAKHIDIVQTEDKAVQTELHPIPSFIDKDYSWNIWDLKRKACQLASIMDCKTHSTQTKYSSMRLEFGCQTDNWRSKGIQTTKDEGTCTPGLQTFLWGLRGQKDGAARVLKLPAQTEE